jgi:hypothetical protein
MLGGFASVLFGRISGFAGVFLGRINGFTGVFLSSSGLASVLMGTSFSFGCCAAMFSSEYRHR